MRSTPLKPTPSGSGHSPNDCSCVCRPFTTATLMPSVALAQLEEVVVTARARGITARRPKPL